MGWSGYGLYDGDGTQTCHLNYLHWAIPGLSNNQIMENFLLRRKTSIPKEYLATFKKGVPNILKKMKIPKAFQWNEDLALDWQMLLALFIDNNLKVPHQVMVYGSLATHYLLGEHARDFNEPAKRRSSLRRFLKKVSKFSSVKASKEINKKLQ